MCSEKQDVQKCNNCGVEKPWTGDYFYETVHRNRGGKVYRERKCIPCRKKYQTERQYIRRYGITKQTVEARIVNQGGRCTVCERKFALKGRLTKPFVDHCHKSGKVRGIICNNCNTALGQVRDSTLVLQRLIDYLNDDIV